MGLKVYGKKQLFKATSLYSWQHTDILFLQAFQDGLAMTSGTPYPMGVDPTWHGTRTELTYLNSLKMKMSIIMGAFSLVLQSQLRHFDKCAISDCRLPF